MRTLIGTVALVMVVVAVIAQKSGIYPQNPIYWPEKVDRLRTMHHTAEA